MGDEHTIARVDQAAWASARRPKRCRLVVERRLRRMVEQKLGLDWAPEQIAAWLVSAYPDDPTMHVSHETIYRALYVQALSAAVRRDEREAGVARRRSLNRRASPRGGQSRDSWALGRGSPHRETRDPADSVTVVVALARRGQQLPRALRQSLTWDRGKEMAQHAQFTIATDVQVYFCDPQSPSQL